MVVDYYYHIYQFSTGRCYYSSLTYECLVLDIELSTCSYIQGNHHLCRFVALTNIYSLCHSASFYPSLLIFHLQIDYSSNVIFVSCLQTSYVMRLY